MILNKENYESRGAIKGFLRFIWMLFKSSKQHSSSFKSQCSQGIPVLVKNSDEGLVCQSCRECEKVCPTNAIKVEGKSGENPKEFYLDPLRCTSCMECVRACPTDALRPLGKSVGAFHAEGAHPLNKDELISLAQSRE